MGVDLGEQLRLPTHITETDLWPDTVLWSDSIKNVLMPWEEWIEEAFEQKREKYEELRSNCQRKG